MSNKFPPPPQLLFRPSSVIKCQLLTPVPPATTPCLQINASALADAATMYLVCLPGTPVLDLYHLPNGLP